MLNICVTFCAGFAGALTLARLKIPGGMLIGAVCGTVALSLFTGMAEMPFAAKFVAQVAAGAFIGCSVGIHDIAVLKRMRAPAAVVIISFLLLNVVLGLILHYFTGLDMITALMCAIPGGMSDVPLIASDIGADVASVLVLQFVRLSVGIGFFPLWISWMYNRFGSKGGRPSAETEPCGAGEGRVSPSAAAAAFTAAFLCGFVGLKLRVPAGALLFSIAGTLALKMTGIPAAMPKRFKRLAQALSGTYIGCSVGPEALRNIPALILPACIIIAGYMLNASLTGLFLHKKFHIPFKEAMLMMTPAGASDMALISADIGVHSIPLLVMHIFRMLMAASVFPQIVYHLAKFLNG